MTTYVIFNRRVRNTRWWHHFLDKKFNHVFLATAMGDKTLVVDCLLGRVRVAIYDQEVGEYVVQAMDHWKAVAIIRVPMVDHNAHPMGPLFGFHNCVTITRSFLHMPGFVLTPRQFFKRLLKEPDAYVIKSPIY